MLPHSHVSFSLSNITFLSKSTQNGMIFPKFIEWKIASLTSACCVR